MKTILEWVCFLFLANTSNAANILVVILMPSRSHQIPALSLSGGLLRKGHHVTFIGTNSLPELEQSKNFTFVDLSFAYRGMSGKKTSNSSINLQQKLDRWVWPEMYQTYFNLAKEEIQSEPFQQFLREIETSRRVYDSIIIEGKYSLILVPLLRHFCGPKPVIAFSSLSMETVIENALGSIQHLSFVPMLFNGYSDRMSFWQKVDNWFSTLWVWGSIQSKTFAVAQDILATFGIHGVTMDEVYRNISLFMIASNPMYYYPRMLAPNIVTVGPLHIRSDGDQINVLPKDIQAWLDGAETGVIYMSFGSNMKSISLPEAALSSLVQVMSKLSPKYRVLWKWESDNPLPGEPKNILTKKWLPQKNILAHPKVKLFITQGGLQSFQEAVHFGVPLLGIPFFGDQNLNTEKFVTSGIGVKLDPSDLMKPLRIQMTLDKILLDKKYADKMKHHSEISKEFTSRGMAKAINMVEHITQFGGDHLRPVTAEISYPIFFCWHIFSLIVVTVFLILYTLKCNTRLTVYSTVQRKKNME